eukprot:gb/GFBE01071793.1/.p1 GENE.gb/GFBE01071793.1/~~gb/GFBE01071793.1/.p1  ORF type:complete len:205 (+),score=23.48 gb/GFBE01071793.1/:1-615(+)
MVCADDEASKQREVCRHHAFDKKKTAVGSDEEIRKLADSYAPVRMHISTSPPWTRDSAAAYVDNETCWETILGGGSANHLNQFDKWDKCMSLIQDYEWQRHESYDWVAVVRPDFLLAQHVRPICAYEQALHTTHDWALLMPRSFAGEFLTAPLALLRNCRAGDACCRSKKLNQGEALIGLHTFPRNSIPHYDNAFHGTPYRKAH